MSFRLPHTATSAAFVFFGDRLQPTDDESWGLDNLAVHVLSVPAGAAPFITRQPKSKRVHAWEPVVFTVEATTNAALGYQWRFNGQPIPGATNAYHVIRHASAAASGRYAVEVGNPFGMVQSEQASLSIAPPNYITVRQSGDNGDGSLRAALNQAARGDIIVFDPETFPPESPVSINVETGLPGVWQGGITIDASDAGVILDGRQTAQRREWADFDAFHLTLDGGTNVILNGDFDNGFSHWCTMDERAGHGRVLEASGGAGSPAYYSCSSRGQERDSITFYDSASRTVAYGGWPADDATSSIWIPAAAGQRAVLDFFFRNPGDGQAYILGRITTGGYRELAGTYLDWNTREWRWRSTEALIPSDCNAVAVYMRSRQSQRFMSGLVLQSPGNTVRGLQILGFPNVGLIMDNYAYLNTVGGSQLRGVGPIGEGNVFSGNGEHGIGIWGYGTGSNTISGNFVGTDVNGLKPLPNGNTGVQIADRTKGNTIGGLTEAERNIISANHGHGIGIYNEGTEGTTVINNYIGLGKNGSLAMGNDYNGLDVAWFTARNILGLPGAGNVISGNRQSGILFYLSPENRVQGNLIGMTAPGTTFAANAGDGISIYDRSTNNLVGGADAGAGNTIAGNGANGVQIDGATTVQNTLSRNRIHSNGGQALFLSNGGNRQLIPPLIQARGPETLTGSTYPGGTVDVFSDTSDEARFYEGTSVADSSGKFRLQVPGGFHAQQVTATVTDTQGNTSTLAAGGQAGQVIYQSGFDNVPDTEWSFRTVTRTPVGQRTFLGPLSASANTLTLTNLPPHTDVCLALNLFIMGTWDGNGTTYGPDIWRIESNGTVVYQTTFNNSIWGQSSKTGQSFPGEYPDSSFDHHSAATEVGTFGYGPTLNPKADAVYHVTLRFPHQGGTLQLSFRGVGLEGVSNESWGLEDIEVRLHQNGPDAAPAFAVNPVGQKVNAGETTAFSAVPTGAEPMALQWLRNGAPVAFATNRWLIITNAWPGQDGVYTLQASNAVGVATSATASLTIAAPAWTQWTSGTGANKHWYGRTMSRHLEWPDAEAEAEAFGGHLVAVQSTQEYNYITNNFLSGVNRTEIYWLGLNDAQQEGRFVWSTGEAATFTRWQSGEPNDGIANAGAPRGFCRHELFLRGGVQLVRIRRMERCPSRDLRTLLRHHRDNEYLRGWGPPREPPDRTRPGRVPQTGNPRHCGNPLLPMVEGWRAHPGRDIPDTRPLRDDARACRELQCECHHRKRPPFHTLVAGPRASPAPCAGHHHPTTIRARGAKRRISGPRHERSAHLLAVVEG